MKTKSIFKSKTAALAFITAVAGAASYFVPSIGSWVAESSDIILSVLGVVGLILRMVTSGKVSLFPSEPKNESSPNPKYSRGVH